MSELVTAVIRCVQPGEKHWEAWWVKQYGHTTTREPTEADQIGFATFDLTQRRLPRITRSPSERLEVQRIPRGKLHEVTSVLQYHGFVVDEVVDAD